MKNNSARTWAQYLGIAASIAVPAIVIAQQQQRNPPADGTFAPQTLLRAADVEQLRDALADAIARINELQANAGVTLTKENLYERVNESAPAAPNAVALANSACDDNNDILVGCSCEGRLDGTNNLAFDLRRMSMNNRSDNSSVCTCQGLNTALDNGARTLRAVAQCLTVP